jgi:hypothetical protein
MAQARFICRSGRLRPVRSGIPLWRLIGANNRELGRAPAVVVQSLTGDAAILRLKARLPEASSRVKLAGLDSSSWTWSVECDGELLAVSGRPYLRQRECQYSLWQFLAAVPIAVVVAEPGRPSGPGIEEVSAR